MAIVNVDELTLLRAQLQEAHHDLAALEDENAQLRATLVRLDSIADRAIAEVERARDELTRLIARVGGASC